MSDTELRALERRWRETGALEDEVALLQARRRSGELTTERLELAAYLGSAAAPRILGREPTPPPANLANEIKGLDRWGIPVAVRAAVAIARGAMRRAPVTVPTL